MGLTVKEHPHYHEVYIDNINEGNSFGLNEAEQLSEWILFAKETFSNH